LPEERCASDVGPSSTAMRTYRGWAPQQALVWGQWRRRLPEERCFEDLVGWAPQQALVQAALVSVAEAVA
jgi:hypothetical protein